MEYDVVIVPSFAQAEAWRKAGALERRSGLFAQSVVTFESWIADLWELQGDGRILIDPVAREALMHRVVGEVERESERGLVGIAPVASRCVKQAAGVDAFERAVSAAQRGEAIEGLSAREVDVLLAIARYEDALRGRGLVEQGEAAALLAQASERVFPEPLHILVAFAGHLSWIQEQFFAQCGMLDVTVAPAEGLEGIGKVDESVDLRFAFPAGKLAQPGLVADVILERDDFENVIVTSKDPLGLFGEMERRLSDAGCRIRAQATVAFPQTAFGQVFLACRQALEDDSWNPAPLTDAISSFFGGLSRSEALKVDKLLRANRVARKDEAVSDLRTRSELFDNLLKLAQGSTEKDLTESMERRVQASGRNAAWRAEQLAAIGKLRDALSAVEEADVGMDVCTNILERSSVAVTVKTEPQQGACRDILVTTWQVGATLPKGCCDMAVLADLTSDDYPIAEKDDALSTLLSSLGLAPEESALSKARREFSGLLGLATQRIVLCRPLGDANADDTYPAVMLEELIDAYRADPSDASEVDNAYRLPAALQEGLVERGEELLFANAHAGRPDEKQGAQAEVLQPHLDDVSPQWASDVAPKRRTGEGAYFEGLCPSPSQIEVYLECPYLWFANRRLNIEALDEGFGPLERGSFAHRALETFYRRFQQAGHAKVNADSLEEARTLMRAVARELARSQYEEKPGSGRLVAANELEKREVEALCEQLVGYLDYEATLLPTFHPAFFEYQIDVDHAVEYAGHHVVGTVDRIDVDDAGHAVIIDYKGSVNAEHEIDGKAEGHCGKVQTRIYAQAVKRALGLNVVAALYVSYGRTPAVAGAYDPRVLDAAHLPGVRAERCSCGLLEAPPDPPTEDFSLASLTFDAMLDETEAIVERALEAMGRGVITPAPANPKTCTYCPVLACPNRGA